VQDTITIALDAMGGDFGPQVVVPATVAVARRRRDLQLVLVGQEPVLQEALAKQGASDLPQISVHHASDVVSMDELPSVALRGKKDSSMRVAINLVKDGAASACVSAGNTGALMATARFVLRTLPGIDRPAICTTIPSIRGHTHMLDLGANVDSKSDHLLQFAVMGAELARAVDDVPRPRVALLNIGQEEIKGNDQVKQAAALLAASDLNFVGYIEGDGIFLGKADVVVCDGFVGNVALKCTEGVAKMIGSLIREEFKRSWLSRIAGAFAYPVLRSLRMRIDPRRYNGASLLGLGGIVIKSHGSADAFAYAHAIEIAALESRKDVPRLIRVHLEQLFNEGRAV
jgi:glycerol-3-phosphate acyltransferase PlsX